MRNFDIPMKNSQKLKQSKLEGVLEAQEIEDKDSEIGSETSIEELERMSPQVFGNLSPEALSHIQRLQSELSNMKEVSAVSLEFFVLSSILSLELVCLW